jgi:hypothetical protein
VSPPLNAQETAAPQTQSVPWGSVSYGGQASQSANYQVNGSAGQTAVGYVSGNNHELGVGFWYNVEWAGIDCFCPHQGDIDADGFVTALDLGFMIDILFAGFTAIRDPDCPTVRADFDCDNFATALDLGALIDHLFVGGPPACDPCL